eukprot:GHVP01031429.1.p1 GENE.GHVP01031429.1~~GHVP01031429.1.p1  ORF type:complete len:314 (-),score=52.83 GHVP01031429.1:193-1134(-)
MEMIHFINTIVMTMLCRGINTEEEVLGKGTLNIVGTKKNGVMVNNQQNNEFKGILRKNDNDQYVIDVNLPSNTKVELKTPVSLTNENKKELKKKQDYNVTLTYDIDSDKVAVKCSGLGTQTQEDAKSFLFVVHRSSNEDRKNVSKWIVTKTNKKIEELTSIYFLIGEVFKEDKKKLDIPEFEGSVVATTEGTKTYYNFSELKNTDVEFRITCLLKEKEGLADNDLQRKLALHEEINNLIKTHAKDKAAGIFSTLINFNKNPSIISPLDPIQTQILNRILEGILSTKGGDNKKDAETLFKKYEEKIKETIKTDF